MTITAATMTTVPRSSSTTGISEALDLLDRCAATLLDACRAVTCTDRYINAQLGALRAAAAVLAARSGEASRAHRAGRRGGSVVRNVWQLLPAVAPELGEWAEYFAAASARRRDLEAGVIRIGGREADDALRAAETFFWIVQGALGVPVRTELPDLGGLAVLEAP